MVQPLHIKDAFVWGAHQGAERRDLYTSADGRILDMPAHDAITVDLDGYTLFPGLINAHDHLELNHYPRSKFRERYDNAHQWGEDMNARLDSEPYRSLRVYPLWDRLFIGGLKNLLCGATTVAHHNPPHKELWRKDFPVRVLKKYGWAHSLHFSSDEEIVRSYRSTPPDVPWFIHLAEGTDHVAAGEYRRLKALGCVGRNTVIVHGVGITAEDDRELTGPFGTRLVLCPTTNLFLLQKTLSRGSRFHASRVLLGSDSRLTAEGDLLDELRAYRRLFGKPAGNARDHAIVLMAMTNQFMEGPDYSWDFWKKGKQADFVGLRLDYETNLPSPIIDAYRTDLALVVRDGIPQIGDPEVMAKFRHVQTIPAVLDGKPKAIHRNLAHSIRRCKLKEPGLEVDDLPKGKFTLW
jgi:cytosine/adenosine deaminase-related metal-dependent hydrolase